MNGEVALGVIDQMERLASFLSADDFIEASRAFVESSTKGVFSTKKLSSPENSRSFSSKENLWLFLLLLLLLLVLLLFLTITTIVFLLLLVLLLLLPLLLLPPFPWSGPSWCLFCEAAAEETSSPRHAMAEEKQKEGVKHDNNDHINLKAAGQDGSVVQFKIKRHTPLSKLMKAYCKRQGFSMKQIRFRFDGQPINETDTPAQLEMEDKDTIDVFQQQTGGAY